MRFTIVSTGPAATPGLDRIIEPRTGAVLYFDTRAQARAYLASILPEVPSKNLPLAVRAEREDRSYA